MPPTHCHSEGEIFYTYFCFLPNSNPICWGCNQRWQWHLSTLSHPINKCNDMRTLAHTQMRSHARAHSQTHRHKHTGRHFYVPSLCSCHMPWWTHSSGLCLWKMWENETSPRHCNISPAHRKEIGWEAHIIVNVSVICMPQLILRFCFASGPHPESTGMYPPKVILIPVYSIPLHTPLLVL